MKFFLLVLSSQALLCANVFSQSTVDNGGQQSESSKQVASSIDKFTIKFYAKMAAAHPKENFLFSPFSIAVAFYLVSLGAKCETHRQILKGLSFDTSKISEDEITKGFLQLQQAINQHPPSVILNTTNAFIVDRELPLLQKFMDDLTLFQSDFQKSEKAKDQENTTVGEETSELNTTLFSNSESETLLALINAFYFNGSWVNNNEKQIFEGAFHVDENKVVQVPMMTTYGRYPVGFFEGCQVVEVPYHGDVSVVFVIPNKGQMEDVEKEFLRSIWEKIEKLQPPTYIILTIPLIRASSTIDLKGPLRKLGINDVFSDKADLSGITEGRSLKLSKATHTAVVTMGEGSTEAAALSLRIVPRRSLPPLIEVKGPFIMAIVDKVNKVNLFTGRIMNPQE